MRGLVWLGGVVIIAGAAAVLAVRNATPVDVDLLVGALSGAPLWGVMLGSFFVGALLVATILSWPYLRLRLRIRTQARQITRLEQEVHGLRTLPLPDEVSGVREG